MVLVYQLFIIFSGTTTFFIVLRINGFLNESHNGAIVKWQNGIKSCKAKFTITNKINNYLLKIERARGFLDATRLKEKWIKKFNQGYFKEL